MFKFYNNEFSKEVIIIADAELHTSLAFIRSLSKYNLKIISIGKNILGGYLSKYVWKKFSLSKSTDDEYYNFIYDVAKIENVKMVFAHYEKTLLKLYNIFKDGNINTKLIIPPINIFKFACNKKNVLQIAEKLELPIPKTIFLDLTQNQYFKDVVEKMMPCFIKVNEEIDIPPGPGNRYMIIKTKNEIHLLDKFVNKHNKLLVQQYIKGYGYGVAGVFNKGNPLAIGGHVRLRESFKSGGVSTFCASKIKKEPMSLAMKLMKELNWTGIAMIEFKITYDDIPYFMELNPRFWGTIPLYIISGLDIPVITYNLYNDNYNKNSEYTFKEGIRMRFLLEDLNAIQTQYAGLKKIDETIKLIADIAKVKDGVFDLKDPLPFLLPTAYYYVKNNFKLFL